MQRFLFRLLFLGWLTVGLAAALHAQTRVYYKDGAKKTEVNGAIVKEDAAEVQVKPNIGAVKTFSVADVLDMQYEVKADLKKDWNKAWTAEWTTAQKHPPESAERKAALTDALTEYTKLLPKVAGTKEAERQVQYKIAMLTATLGEGDKAQMKVAADLLDKFQKAHGTSWQIVSVLNRAAELNLDLGEHEKAARAYDTLKKVPGITPETKADCDLKAANLLIKAKKHTEAEGRLKAILDTLKPTNPLYEQLRMKQILCKANTPEKFKDAVNDLRKLKEATKDPARVALVYNTLGDCYMMNNQPKDAVYEYLFVDMIYNGDKTEHLRAVTSLVQVFKDLRQPDRAKEYAMKLDKLKAQ